MFKWLKRKKIHTINLVKGDTLTLLHEDEELIQAPISEYIAVDEVGIFEVKDELGMKKGIGGVFGESSDS